MFSSSNRVLVQGCPGSVATEIVCLSIKSDTVATNSKIASNSLCDFDSDCGDESEKDDENLQEAYEKMYSQWLKVCATNRALNNEIQELRNLKAKVEGKVVQLETSLAEKDKKLKSIAIELERTKKMLRLLNNSTNRLDHLIIVGNSFDDHSGVRYKDESSSTKTILVKFGLLTDSINLSYNKLVVKSVATKNKSAVKQSIAIGKFLKHSGQKRKGKNFVPICHFCGVKGHIRPRCFTLMNFLENHYEKSNFIRYFQKPTHRPKIDLGNDSRKI